MWTFARTLCAFALSTIAALAIACGDGNGGNVTGNPPPTTQPPAVTTVVSEGSRSGLEPRMLLPVVFNTAQAGSLSATVDWTNATDNVEAYLASGSNPCTIAQFNSGTCPFIAVAASATAKPEHLTAGGQAGGTYTLYIGNRGPKSESVAWQVTLSTGGGARAAATNSAEPASGPFENLAPPISE